MDNVDHSMEGELSDLEIRTSLAEWIERQPIAETILDNLKEAGIAPTLANGSAVWMDFLLTELGDGVDRSIEALQDKGELHSEDTVG